MIGIQEICARIGLQTGRGLASVIRKHYPRPVLYFCVSLLFVANTVNLGADLGAMAASGQMLLGFPIAVWLIFMALITAALQIFTSYGQYSRVLRFLALSQLAYVLVAFLSIQDWEKVMRSTFIPELRLDGVYLMNLIAIFGTNISPYLFFWQASQEVEEKIDHGKGGRRNKKITEGELKWMRTDVAIGMIFSNVVTWAIIATTASTLHPRGIAAIESATQAAEALKPLAGDFASAVFAMGIIGTGLLAVPILAGSSAYAVAETFRLREGLYLKLRQAPGFYGIILLSTLIGFAMDLAGINPIQGLYYAAILNGIVSPPMLIIIMLIGNNRKILGGRVNGTASNLAGWIAAFVVTAATAALLASLALGK